MSLLRRSEGAVRLSGPVVVLVILGLAVALGASLTSSFRSHGPLLGKVNESLTSEFRSYLSSMEGQQRLQVAELKQVESVERTSEAKVLWDSVQLPTLVVGITAPTTFVYYVDLQSTWDVQVSRQAIKVIVPELMPGVPAPDLSATRFEVKQGSVFRDEKAALAALQKTITPLLSERALTYRALVRETARKQVEEFVWVWLRQRFPGDAQKIQLQVQFAEELPESLSP